MNNDFNRAARSLNSIDDSLDFTIGAEDFQALYGGKKSDWQEILRDALNNSPNGSLYKSYCEMYKRDIENYEKADETVTETVQKDVCGNVIDPNTGLPQIDWDAHKRLGPR